MTATIDKTDNQLKTDVLAELGYEPTVKTADIGVLVKEGSVTLNGYVTSYGEKCNALRAVKRVSGVAAIADKLEIQLPGSFHRTDGDIGAAAADQLAWSTNIPRGAVNILVRDGWLTLDGEVEGWHLKNAAENLVRYLAGVKGVTNLITVSAAIAPGAIEAGITEAFKRSALLDASRIGVVTSGSKVTLRGSVRNYVEQEEAERVAWAAPGVTMVENHLKPAWPWGFDD